MSKINKKYHFFLERWANLLVVAAFVLSNVMNFFLVFKSSPIVLSLGVLKVFFVGISRLMIPLVYIMMLVLAVYYASRKAFLKSVFSKIFTLIVVLIGIVKVAAYYYFEFQDFNHYSNFTFSKFYIYLPSLKFDANFQVLLVIVGFIGYWMIGLNKWRNVINPDKALFFLMICLIPLMIFISLSDLPVQLGDELAIYHSFVLRSNNKQYPDFYGLKPELDFIVKYTPENSVIIHPTQSNPFPLLGNEPVIRHDLFPRTLVSAGLAGEYFKNPVKGAPTYYILKKDRDPVKNKMVLYPDLDLNAKEIIILNTDGSVSTISGVLYTPNLANGLPKFDLGLIKIQ